MPSRLFDFVDATLNVVTGYTIGPGGSITPSLLVTSFGVATVSGTGTFVGLGAVSSAFQYNQSADINFQTFPAIPITSRITKVVVSTGSGDASVSGSAAALGLNIQAITVALNGNGALLSHSQSGSGAQSYNAANPIGGSSITVDYSHNTLSYADFVAAYGSVGIELSCNCSVTGFNGGSLSYAVSAGAGFSLIVTWSTGPFSWYIPYETRIVNGRPFRVPTGPVVLIDDNDPNPPDPAAFYNAGSEADIPAGPVLYYWFSPDWWFFFPLSILIPDDISDWIPTLVPPTCTSCLTLTLGTITILVADASGAYTLQSGKTNDTMYVRVDPLAVTTDDAPIPSPNAKIGFVP